MVTGTSIWANVVPLIGLLDLGYLFESFPQQTKALDARRGQAVWSDALIAAPTSHIIGWAYNFGSRSVLLQVAGQRARGPRRQADPNACPTRSSPNACA